MTIPATVITIDGATAWLVVRSITDDLKYGTGRRRTLDVECVLPMCVNGKRGYWQDGHPCGRCRATGTYQLSVHVVEVLPIVATFDQRLPLFIHDSGLKAVVVLRSDGRAWIWDRADTNREITGTLPADAAPDKYAVRLAVHT
jgi:hypothetical protein